MVYILYIHGQNIFVDLNEDPLNYLMFYSRKIQGILRLTSKTRKKNYFVGLMLCDVCISIFWSKLKGLFLELLGSHRLAGEIIVMRDILWA